MKPTDNQIIEELRNKFGNDILEITPFPKAYFKDLQNVKAIYLGCDPSNGNTETKRVLFPYAMAINTDNKLFKNFVKDHEKNLEQIGLSLDDVYVQNLCQNYFVKVTSENLTLWKKAAKEYWIERLKEELSILDNNIPILLTSSYLYEILINKDTKKHKPLEFYNCSVNIPIPPKDNLLDRPLIPMYRNKIPTNYHLTNPNWNDYRVKIMSILQEKL